jgi:metacaspase-1
MASKKSLLIGINYTGSQNELHGCHQDVENVAEFLSFRGYANDPRSQVILRDDMEGPYYPSGHNILVTPAYILAS